MDPDRSVSHMLSALSPARRRFVLAFAGVVVAVVLAVVATMVARSRADAVHPVAQDRPGPVVLVSGYGGSVSALAPLVQALSAQGRDTVVAPVVRGGTGDLAAQAEALRGVVEATLRRTGAGSVDLVGYSAGGVVARAFVRDHGGGSLVRRVLTVGSPHHGTEVAQLALDVAGGCPTACRELAPDSSFLLALNAGDETPPGPEFVSVWSSADGSIRPRDSSALDGALDFTVQSVCPAELTSHGGLPGDPVVLATLTSVLAPGPPAAPTGVACG
jgi:triacylglycerol lipase